VNTQRLAALLIIAGAAIAVVGLALIYPPAAIIAAGACLTALGLDERRRA
jgi:hypothetical protein